MERMPTGASPSSAVAHLTAMAATDCTFTGGLSTTSDAGSFSSVLVSS
jgi:hypothetical protein